mmetsp:Transcript_32534/g.58405  ORF Transcript_32534/g.58405 Transcript_32534/m.58405 type:complete len:85 (+) Transcript_32534:97-351(+)
MRSTALLEALVALLLLTALGPSSALDVELQGAAGTEETSASTFGVGDLTAQSMAAVLNMLGTAAALMSSHQAQRLTAAFHLSGA